MMTMLSVPGRLLVISTGTTAPFSAMSGAFTVISLLGVASAAPSPARAPATVLDSKAALL